jgi:hypothetical protein
LIAGCGAPGAEAGRGQGAAAQPAEAGAKTRPRRPNLADLEPLPPVPWTEDFQSKGTLLANTIKISGPSALREHLRLVLDDVRYDHETKAISEGLRQRVRTRSGDECRAQLDNWLLVGQVAIEVLEFPVGNEVRVTATGDAVWMGVDGEEKRSDELVFVSTITP